MVGTHSCRVGYGRLSRPPDESPHGLVGCASVFRCDRVDPERREQKVWILVFGMLPLGIQWVNYASGFCILLKSTG